MLVANRKKKGDELDRLIERGVIGPNHYAEVSSPFGEKVRRRRRRRDGELDLPKANLPSFLGLFFLVSA